MIKFTTAILKFGEQGEKTGWSYILIPAKLAQQLKPGNKKSFRTKGKLDDYNFSGIALMPMGGGDFIMPLNATIRKAIKKRKGEILKIQIEEDKNYKAEPSPELMECLNDEPAAKTYFYKLPPSHRNYYIKWIESAKTDITKTKRIAQCVTALSKGFHYGEMMRSLKQERDDIMR